MYSEKQIAWAKNIRRDSLKVIDDENREMRNAARAEGMIEAMKLINEAYIEMCEKYETANVRELIDSANGSVRTEFKNLVKIKLAI